jgi:hypothetical protein
MSSEFLEFEDITSVTVETRGGKKLVSRKVCSFFNSLLVIHLQIARLRALVHRIA